MNTQDILKLLDDMYKKGPPYRSDGYNVAIREIKEYILEMEENEDDGLGFGGGDRKGKEISSLPSIDIDSLQRYYHDPEYSFMLEDKTGEYIRYDDLVNLIK